MNVLTNHEINPRNVSDWSLLKPLLNDMDKCCVDYILMLNVPDLFSGILPKEVGR